MSASALAWLGKNAIDGRMGKVLAPLADKVLGRSFPARSRLRVHVYYTRSRISFSQVYPFLQFSDEIAENYAADIRLFDVERLLDGELTPVGADVVIVQPWFTVDPDRLSWALERVNGANPRARVIFLDSYAHSDLRLARHVDPFVDLYVKKSLFRDRAEYFQPTRGDTNLTDYYGWQYGCAEKAVDWLVPRSIVPKLRAGANFFTAPGLLEGFLGAPPDLDAERPIDLHARLTASGSPWYMGMRTQALRHAEALPGRVVTGTGISRGQFMEELFHSRLVFSPFGYGELCWRDVEGFMTGAVVVKQDMSHLETCPDLYRPWETYVPVSWDFSDFRENIARVLNNTELRRSIAMNAWRATHRYLTDGQMMADMGLYFDGARPVAQPAQEAGVTALGLRPSRG
ncbi:MAG: glycosyltransferase [Pseudomonadota bacterium]